MPTDDHPVLGLATGAPDGYSVVMHSGIWSDALAKPAHVQLTLGSGGLEKEKTLEHSI